LSVLLPFFVPPLMHAPAQVLNGAIAAALFNLIYTYLLSQRVKWYAMCPWLDLINHRGTVEARPRGRPRAGSCLQQVRCGLWLT